MDYSMRFLQTGGEPTTIPCLAAALYDADPSYGIVDGCRLTYDGTVIADLAVHRPGDGVFEQEVAALRARVEGAAGPGRKRVLEVLGSTTAVVLVRVPEQERSVEEMMTVIDPLWLWLFHNRQGLVQADDEGYYTQTRCIFAVE